MMLYYLVHLEQQDGEHEHSHAFIAKGVSREAVESRIKREQLYEFDGKPHKKSMLSYGDGMTAVDGYWLEALPRQDYDVLSQYFTEV